MGPYIQRKSIKGGTIDNAINEIENATFPDVTENLLLHFGTNNLSDHANNEDQLVKSLLSKYEKLVTTALAKTPSTCKLKLSAMLYRSRIFYNNNNNRKRCLNNFMNLDRGRDCDIIDRINTEIEALAKRYTRVNILKHDRIDNDEDAKCQSDGLHLSYQGVGMLVTDMKKVIYA